MLCTVDQDDVSGFVNFIDHPKLSSTCRVESFELAPEWLAGPTAILRDRPEYGLDDCGPDLVG